MSGFGWSYPPGCEGTPYDDDPDYIQEAERFLKRNQEKADKGELRGDEEAAFWIIGGLLEIIDEQ